MRYRLRWAKRGKLRYLTHHDEALVFERSARRARLPLSYSRGFSPHPKIAFGSGLPVGYGSEVELMDIGLDREVHPDELVETYNAGLPQGLAIVACRRLRPGAKSLGARIEAADYVIGTRASWLKEAMDRFMSLATYEFVRPYKGADRADDIRAGVLEVANESAGSLRIRCVIKPRSTRPSDVLEALRGLAGAERTPASFQRVALLAPAGGGLAPLDETWDSEENG